MMQVYQHLPYNFDLYRPNGEGMGQYLQGKNAPAPCIFEENLNKLSATYLFFFSGVI